MHPLDPSAPSNSVQSSDGEIVSRRRFDAAPTAIFAAFTDPARLARWWGPEGFTNTFHEFDLRPGGRWRFDMHGPDGTTYPNLCVFVEITAPERFVLVHEQTMHRFTLDVTLMARGTGTELTWHMRFDDPAEAGRIGDFIRTANEQNFNRLAAEVARKG